MKPTIVNTAAIIAIAIVNVALICSETLGAGFVALVSLIVICIIAVKSSK